MIFINKSVLIALCGLIGAALPQVRAENAAPAFEQLKKLVGSWEGTAQWSGARIDSYPMNVRYSLTGNGSALVEDLITEKVPVMTSIYHLDGNDLRLTHFCGAGNQPRLKAKRIDLDQRAFDFDFVDITNLKSPDAPHVHGLEIRLTDSNHITVTFLFQNGEKESREEITLKRTERPT